MLLTSVYAIRVHRIAALQRDALRLEGGRPRIRLGRIDIDLPDIVTPWLATIADDRLIKRRAAGGESDATWIFPGARHGDHMLPSSLATKLKAVGVLPITAHQASAATLISQLPPAVIARLLGVRISTVAGWQQRAGSYSAHR